MNLIKMRYKGFEFCANPESIAADFSKHIGAKNIPFGFAKTKELGFYPTVIKGSGSFVGDEAQKSANRFIKVFKSEGSSYLFAVDFPPMKAYLKGLSLSRNAQKNCIDYSFEFVEDPSGKRGSYAFGYTFAGSGENLFDIANRTNTDALELFKCNDYKDMFSVSEGDRVWLR